MSGLKSLEDIREALKNCRDCELWKEATQAVPGEGKPGSLIMVVGEAPGREEDAQGRPFVGRAGKLLRATLNNLGAKEVYITNVVKHRPPNNRKPKEKEVRACSKYLLLEIEAVKPKVILALGSTACYFFTGDKKVGEAFDKDYEFKGVKVVVGYHPAAVLRNPNLKGRFEEQIKKALDAALKP